jgi:hypothetical protein
VVVDLDGARGLAALVQLDARTEGSLQAALDIAHAG